jgi:hypothetical protein
MGVLSVLLGVAALPSSAMAQTTPDTTAPTITIATPADGAQFKVGEVVNASFVCEDPSGVTECTGTVPNGSRLDTSTAGPKTFTVTARDAANNPSSVTRNYSVVVSQDGGVGGETPATLNLTLGSAPSFSPFIPGQARDYLMSMTASVVTSSADAALTVADASSAHTGHLVNGDYVLPRALEAGAYRGAGPLTGTAPVGGTAAPTALLTWDGPVNESVTLAFKQSIAASDALRTGPYAKTLTFTLSTTNP